MSKHAAVFVLLSLTITLSASALDQKEKAKGLFDRGVMALEKRNFQNALDAFEEAYEISPHWAVLAHIGTCHANLNNPIKAIQALEQYLLDGGNNIPDDERTTAKEIIVQQRKKVGVLVLSVDKDGIEALVDGETLGKSPFEEKLLLPGHHEIAVIFGDNDIIRRNFNIDAGQEYLLRIEQERHLTTAPPPPPPPVVEEEPKKEKVIHNEPPPPTFAASPFDDGEKASNLVPFYIAIGFTVASAAVTGVGWGFFAHHKISENNFADHLEYLRSEYDEFKSFTWEDTCASKDIPEDAEYAEEKQHYCNTEMNRREFAKNADRWFIVGVAGSGALVLSGGLAIAFYALRHRFAKDDDSFARSLQVVPHITPYAGGLNLNIAF